MAAASGNSKDLTDKAVQLARMRWFATGLLVLMGVVFILCHLYVDRWPHLAYVRAFAEAAMVGAVADWFAVVALFRRPFGLPIPHTAIIARNKDRIGRSLGTFICNNFLAPEAVAAKLDSLDLAGRAVAWLRRPDNAAALAKRGAGLLPVLLDALEDEHVRRFLHGAVRRGIGSVDTAPLASRVLSVLMARGHHLDLFDRLLDGAEGFLFRNEGLIRAKVADRSWRWLPRWVDEKLADKVVVGMLETIVELRDPAHPWRDEFQGAVAGFVDKLAHDPDFRARGEAIKAEVMANPMVEEYLDSVWAEIKARLRADLARDEGVLRQGLERALQGFAARLDDDPRMQAVLNRWARRIADRLVVPHRDEIGAFIAAQVQKWDTRTLVDKLELQVGRDLQYIRVNGTLVGGLVGLGIHMATTLLR